MLRKELKTKTRWFKIGAAMLALGALILLSRNNGATETRTEQGCEPLPQLSEASTEEKNALPDESCIGIGIEQVIYCNPQSLKLECGPGRTLSVGVATDSTDAIYLNPCFRYIHARNESEQYGFLLRASSGILECSGQEISDRSSADNGGETSLVIAGRTWDCLLPGTYYNPENYGIRWTSDYDAEGAAKNDTKISVHVIRLTDGTLMGSAEIRIEYDERLSGFRMTSLESADVLSTGELTKEKRAEVIGLAAEFLTEGNGKHQIPYSSEEVKNNRDLICVEKIETPLFGRLFSPSGEAIFAAAISAYDLIAVHLPYVGFGFLTVYLAPEMQSHGLSESQWGNDPPEYTVVGYDAICPLTHESFMSFLLPEDRTFFE